MWATKRGVHMKRSRVVLSAFVLGLIIFSPSTASAQLPRCADLATNPAYGLAGGPPIPQPPSAGLSPILFPAGGGRDPPLFPPRLTRVGGGRPRAGLRFR